MASRDPETDRADREVDYRRRRLCERYIDDWFRRRLNQILPPERPDPFSKRNTAPIEREIVREEDNSRSRLNQIISPERPDSFSQRSMAPEIDPEDRVNQIRHRMSRLHLDREEDNSRSRLNQDVRLFDETGSTQEVER